MMIRKMLRDVWKNKVPFIAIFLMMFAGNFIFSGITSEYNGISVNFLSYVEETNLADAWIMGNSFNEEETSKLKAKAEIESVEKRMLIPATLNTSQKQSIDLYVLDQENSISGMKISEGEGYGKNAEGIWLDAAFAKENKYRLHDKIKFKANGLELEKEIIGFCYSPEYIYNIKDGEMIPDHKNNGFAFMNADAFPYQELISWNQLLITGNNNIKKAVQDTLTDKDIIIVLQKELPSYSMINDEITQHKEIGLLFVGVFLFIAVLVTITTVHRLLNSQRLQIGILKATGFKKRQLYLHYVSHSSFVCLAGAFIGWCCGFAVLPHIIFPIMSEMYIIPDLNPVMLEWSWLLPMTCALLCLMISLFVCKKYLAGSAAKILYSNSIEKEYKELPIPSLWEHLSFYGQWNIRDIFRNKLRSIMTIFGVVGCVSLLYAALGLYTSMNYMSEWTFDKVQTFKTKAVGNFDDIKYKNKLLASMRGEELMETAVTLDWQGKEETVFFTGIESQEYLHLFNSEKQEIELKAGVAISRNTAEKMKIEAGDEIRWKFAGKEKWYTATVNHIICTPMTQGITMLKSEMTDKNIPFEATAVIGNKPDKSDIDTDFVNSIQNKADLKEGMNVMLNASVMLCSIFSAAAILLGSVILYNLGTLSYMERYRDMATLKVLGFNNKRIRKLMIQQNLWFTVVGIIMGLSAGYGLIIVMLSTVQSSIDISIHTPVYVYVASILGTFLLSWVINKLLSRKVYHIDMVAALKANE